MSKKARRVQRDPVACRCQKKVLKSMVHYRNGHRTSYVMSVFEAEVGGGVPQPDSQEVLEVRFVTEREADGLPKASPGFRGATWSPRQARQE